MQIAATRHVVL